MKPERLCRCGFREMALTPLVEEEILHEGRRRCRACGYPINPRWRWRWLADWRDLWVGAFWDRERRLLYLLPLPCLGIVINLGDNP